MTDHTLRIRHFLFLLMFICTVKTLQAQDPSKTVTISSDFERIEIIKMPAGTDMLQGLKAFIDEQNIKNGVILSGIGSVTDYHYHVVSDKNLPPAEEYPKASVPMDLISVQGYILDGRIHAHMTLTDENSAVGGHVEDGTIALTFFIITIGVLPADVEMKNLDSFPRE